jgi:hypothetical protein
MLLVWMKPSLLGRYGNKKGNTVDNSWSIAKLRHLFPNWDGPPRKDSVLEAEFRVANNIIKRLSPMIEEILPLEYETQTMDLLPELRDVLRSLLVTDPARRPSTAQVLASGQLQALKEVLSRMK